jgi:hypothetical protein
MAEPSEWDVPPEKRSVSSGSEQASAAIRLALWTAFAGHLLALIAALTDSAPPSTAVVAAIACSIVAMAALTELARPEGRVRRVVAALTGGHGVVAAILLAGVAPSIPRSIPLAGLAAAASLGVACLAAVGRASTENGPPRPLTMAPGVAAIALVIQALLQRWAATSLSMSLRAAILLSIAIVGVALLASLSIIALRVRRLWAIGGLLAWTVGWVATTADLSSLILRSFGGSFPMGARPLPQLDAEIVQILATVGGVVIAFPLVASIRNVRFRHSAVALLVGYAAFGLVAAVAEHRIGLATDFPGVTALRRNRDLADAITAFALAGVLWMYGRRVVASNVPRASGGRRRA